MSYKYHRIQCRQLTCSVLVCGRTVSRLALAEKGLFLPKFRIRLSKCQRRSEALAYHRVVVWRKRRHDGMVLKERMGGEYIQSAAALRNRLESCGLGGSTACAEALPLRPGRGTCSIRHVDRRVFIFRLAYFLYPHLKTCLPFFHRSVPLLPPWPLRFRTPDPQRPPKMIPQIPLI